MLFRLFVGGSVNPVYSSVKIDFADNLMSLTLLRVLGASGQRNRGKGWCREGG